MYNEIRVFAVNRPGKLSRIAELLGRAGIDILALDLADGGQFGVIIWKPLKLQPRRRV